MDESTHRRPRNRKTARVEPWCTGCGGAPVCRVYCPKNALVLKDDPHHYPFHVMDVDESLCIGCGACAAQGEEGIHLSGCPWNAIVLIPVTVPDRAAAE